MRKLALARVSYLNGFLISHRVNMCFPRLMINMTTPSWIDENACATYPFGHFSGRPILHRNKWSFLVYIIPLRDFVPEWNSPLCHTPLVRTSGHTGPVLKELCHESSQHSKRRNRHKIGLNKRISAQNVKRRYKLHRQYKRRHGWTILKKTVTDCNCGFWKLISLAVF